MTVAMLKELETLPSKEDQMAVLSEIIKNLTPQPRELPPPSETAQRVLKEIRKRVNVSAGDRSDKAEAKVLQRVGNELTEIALKDADLDAIRGRLADRGILPRAEFKIEIDERIQDNLNRYGVAYDEVISAVLNPTMVDTFSLPLENYPDQEACTFIRKIDSSYSIIIHAIRTKATYYIEEGWRVSHRDVNISSAVSAIDVVRSFTEVYGSYLHPSPGVTTKLVSRDYISIEIFEHFRTGAAWLESIADTSIPAEYHATACTIPGRIAIAIYMGYCINVDHYQADLRRRGILR